MPRPRQNRTLKRNAGIALSHELIRVLDHVKGQESRSSFVERLLRQSLKIK